MAVPPQATSPGAPSATRRRTARRIARETKARFMLGKPSNSAAMPRAGRLAKPGTRRPRFKALPAVPRDDRAAKATRTLTPPPGRGAQWHPSVRRSRPERPPASCLSASVLSSDPLGHDHLHRRVGGPDVEQPESRCREELAVLARGALAPGEQ